MSVTAVPLQPTKKSHIFWLWAALILGVLAAIALAWQGTGRPRALRGTNDQFISWNKRQTGVVTTASGLQYQVIKAGEGPNAVDGDGVALQIHGVLRDGKEFQPESPFQFIIGQQPTIEGFVEAVRLMNKGAHFKVWIPPSLGYGPNPNAPAELKKAILIFDIEMKEHLTAQQIQMMQMQQMMQRQQQQGAGGPGGPEGAPQQ